MTPRERQRRLLEALERWRRGEQPQASFREIAELLYRPLQGFFVRRGFGSDESHDLTQESLVGIYKGLSGFRDEARFTTWAFTIAENTALKTRRGRRTQKRGAGTELLRLEDQLGEKPAETPDPLAQVIDRERRERLRRAALELPPRMRAVLIMYLYQERSRRDIAEALGISPETVKTQLAEARRRLAEVLADQEDLP